MKKRIFIASVAAIFLIILCAVIFMSGLIANNTNAIKSENYAVKNSMIGYLIINEKEKYITDKKASLGEKYEDLIGLESNDNLRKKKSPYGDTWFNYFYDIVVKDAENMLLYCEAANKAGIKLDDKELKEIDDVLNNTNVSKQKISKSNFKKLLEIEKLSQKYIDNVIENKDQEEYKDYYNKNHNYYDCVDYKFITVPKEKAEKLSEDIKNNGFDSVVTNYLKENKSSSTLEECTVIGGAYDSSEFTEWAFSDDRKIGDLTVLEKGEDSTVYYITKTAYPFDYELVSGQIAVINRDNKDYNFKDLSTEFKANVKSDVDFIKFANENKFTVKNNGTIYKEGQPDDVLMWFYDSKRKVGDTAAFEYGRYAYILRFKNHEGSYYKEILDKSYKENIKTEELEKLSKEFDLKKSTIYKFTIKSKS